MIEQDPHFITPFSKTLLQEFYLRPDESINSCFERAANAFCYGDYELRDRIVKYLQNNWMMFASPIISNAPVGTWVPNNSRSLPLS